MLQVRGMKTGDEFRVQQDEKFVGEPMVLVQNSYKLCPH